MVLIPRGLEMLGPVPPVEAEGAEVPVLRLSDAAVGGGPQGFGKGSLFSVLDGCAPEPSALPPKAEKGLLPNYNKYKKEEENKKYY